VRNIIESSTIFLDTVLIVAEVFKIGICSTWL